MKKGRPMVADASDINYSFCYSSSTSSDEDENRHTGRRLRHQRPVLHCPRLLRHGTLLRKQEEQQG
jgi:hypothetical protein